MPRWPDDRPSPEDRFFSKFIPEPNSGCWLWEAGVNACGYGTIRVERRSTLAHRLSWEIHKGVIPEGFNVLHQCDVRCCVNPEHLFLGTQTVNIHDMEAKGRSYHPSGEKHGRAKVTEDDVRTIRADCRPARILAKIYGIAHVNILAIKNRKTWGHV